MKSLRKLFAVLLCLSIVFSLAACQTKPADNTTEPSTESTEPSGSEPDTPTAAEVYDNAKAALDSAVALEMVVTAAEIKTFAGERYEQTTSQTITLTGCGTDSFKSYVTENITQGEVSFSSTEFYDGSTVYMDFEDTLYCSDMAAEEYTERLLPFALLDSSLYGNITAEGNTLTFSDPTVGESWAIYETAVLTDATGTATLSADGTLTSTAYTASYRYGAVGMEISVTVDVAVPENTDLSAHAPADPKAYTTLKYIDAPKMAEMAIAMVTDTNTAVATNSSYLYDEYNDQYLDIISSVATLGPTDQLMAKLETSTEYGKGNNEPRTETQSIIFRDGVSSNGSMTAEDVREFYLLQLTDILPKGNQLAKASITNTGSLLLLEMEAGDSYTQDMYDELLSSLLSDIETDTQYKIIDADIILSIDIYTGFPVFFSLEYKGRQTVDGEKYTITFSTEISYELGSNDAYKTITGEDPPDVEPENKATPLFYHVTGANGEEMWLLGTIHIGDDRTAYLPQAIYDAFNAADALAVEFDILAFEEQMLTDKKLQTQISMAYTYINGTTLKDHVDKEVYDAAISTSKAMGIYDETLVYFKAGALESYISDYYKRHIPEYHTEKGADYRLLTMAKEQNKTILDVENGLDQLKMFTNCSKTLQEYLLEGTLYTDAAEYHDGAMELYEAWCGGDEATVRDLVIDDPADLADMPEDEKVLYEEYKKIMETDRNVGMLNKAIEYLESGDVIFYAVGAAHVMAEDGLVNTLRDAGYTVELVTYP